MTINTVTNMTDLSVIGSSYFSFTKARFYAGLFCRDPIPDQSVHM